MIEWRLAGLAPPLSAGIAPSEDSEETEDPEDSEEDFGAVAVASGSGVCAGAGSRTRSGRESSKIAKESANASRMRISEESSFILIQETEPEFESTNRALRAADS